MKMKTEKEKKLFTKVWYLSLAFIILLWFGACDNDPEKKLDQITVTQDVNVRFSAFTPGVVLNFTPIYTPTDGWGEYFSENDIEYIINVTCNTTDPEFIYTYNNETGFIANTTDNGSYQAYNTYTFTQIFKLKTTVIGIQVINVTVMVGGFATLKDINNINLAPQNIPSIDIQLKKEVHP